MDKMTASESVYGFAAWLTTRDDAVTFGAKHGAAIAAKLVKEWCDTNGLPEPRVGAYPGNLTMPNAEAESSAGSEAKGQTIDSSALLAVPVFSRHWAMPNGDTFTVPIIGQFVQRYLQRSEVSVDPFARNKRWATHTNDLNPATEAEHHMEARAFLRMLIERGVRADLLIFDPPYSPRQISECYATAGLKAGMADTQNARLVKECRDLMRQIARPGAVCLSFGWNSAGMGKKGWKQEEIMLVAHGGCHNDTICLAERKLPEEPDLFTPND